MHQSSGLFRAMTSDQKWVMASTASGFTLENMDIMFLSFALAPMIASLHLSGAAAGWIGSMTNLGMLVGGLIFGLIGDKLGRVKAFSYTIFIFAFGTAAMFFAHQLSLVYLFRFIAGFGAGGEYGVGIALIAENFDQHQIGRLSSVAAIGGQVGAIVAALTAALIIPRFGWNALFLIGVLPVILTFFIRRHVKESPAFLAAKQHTKKTNQRVSIRQLFITPQVAWQTTGLMLMTIVQISGYFGLMNWLPTIVQQRQGLSVAGSSLWMIATILGMSLGMVVFGTLLDRMGARVAFTLFLLGSASVMFIILIVKSTLGLILAGALIGFFSNGMFGGYGAVISLRYPTEILATANSLIMNVGRAIGGFSSVAIGWLMDHYNLSITMACLAGMYLISCLVLQLLPGLRHTQLAQNSLN
ncbi:MAG: MFS transporter [Lactobacillus sp.]